MSSISRLSRNPDATPMSNNNSPHPISSSSAQQHFESRERSRSSLKSSDILGNCNEGTKLHAEDFPVWCCIAKGAAHGLRVVYSVLNAWLRDEEQQRNVKIDKESFELVKTIATEYFTMMALKGKLVYKNVLKLLPQNSKGVNTARAQLKKVFHEMATGRRKLVAGLDAILFGIVSYRSGLEKAIECMNNMFIPQTELNKMELLVLTMAVRSPAVGPAKLCELWSDHFKSLCTEQHAMMLAWVSTRKEAMEWTKAMSPGSSIVSWFRNWQLYGKFRRDYELPLLKLRIKSLKCAAHPASQGNTSGMGTCFCLGGALGINGEEGSPDVESVHRASGSMSSLSSNYPASRMPRALQASSSAPDLMSSQRVTRMSNDAQAQRFSDSYRELSKIIDGGSKSTCATSLATSSVSTASSQENVKHTSTHEKITHTLAVSDETAGDAGSQDIHDNMEVHRRSMIEKIGELSKQLSESHLTQTEGSGACPPAVFTLNRNSDTAA